MPESTPGPPTIERDAVEEGVPLPEEWQAMSAQFLDRYDRQARDIGAANERNEALERRLHEQHEELQATRGSLAEAVQEMLGAIANERNTRKAAERIVTLNKELEGTVRLLQTENAHLRQELDAVGPQGLSRGA